LRGMDTKCIQYYDDIVPIFTKGELPDGTKVAREGYDANALTPCPLFPSRTPHLHLFVVFFCCPLCWW
jgi:hypothetical protein